MSAMATIKEAGQLTLGELATRERVQPPSMTRVIATLTDNGLVERISDPADGRQVLVSLTPEGREVLAEEGRTREAWLSQALIDLTDAELKTLADASDIMMRLVGE
ncbi:MarR family transcriptional regulator [Epidermidibacterium keratini]|uniref:MarR family transcriptional regulator n=2 Tax=Epidermidibacterium keratini TaxID=1891644 RepID=A0A7L4YTP9_9ACTN|nr:MarR family transcriptional regulator [Epidermidibacterium keratini]